MGLWSSVKNAAKKVGNAAASAVGAVGDAVEGAVKKVTDELEDAVNNGVDTFQGWLGGSNQWLCAHAGSVGCRIGNVVLGGISGLLEGIRDVLTKALGIIGKVGEFLGALLRLDFSAALGKLAEIVIDIVDLAISIVRVLVLGTIVDGIVDAWQAENLRQFVRDLIQERFADRPDRIARMFEHLKIESGDWGLPMTSTHRTFVLDSGVMPLRQWHEAGTIDLYAMAGILSGSSFNINRRRTEVRIVNGDGSIESSIPANRYQIADYLDGGNVRLVVYAISRSALNDVLGVARRKCRRLGVKLTWNDEGLGLFERPQRHVVNDESQFAFVRFRPEGNRDLSDPLVSAT